MAEKISGAEVLGLLRGIHDELAQQRTPEPFRIYKATKSGTGTALSLQLRLEPKRHEKGYIESCDGGLFLELAKQADNNDDGFATFDWPNAVRAKLGVPDIQAFLTAIRCRTIGIELPQSLQKKPPAGQDPNPYHMSLFHKTPGGGSTVIEYELIAQGAWLNVSAKRDAVNSVRIGVSIAEEVALEQFLQHCLRQALIWGL